jgi:RNA polymerase sigma factor (sigma-70 family)
MVSEAVQRIEYSTNPLGPGWIVPLRAAAMRALQARGVPFHLAEDAVQEICLAGWQEFGAQTPPDAWVRTLVRNKSVDFIRARRSERVYLTDVCRHRRDAAPSTPPSRIEVAETSLALGAGLAVLDAASREVFLRYCCLGQSLVDIAGALRINPAAARKRLSRARAKLGEALLRRIPLGTFSPT